MQPRKDSNVKRVNFDNTRDSKFEKDIEKLVPKDFKPKQKRRNNKKSHPKSGSNSSLGRNQTRGKDSEVITKHTNHDSWYMKNPLLVEQSGRWNFNIPTGSPDTFKTAAPGVMAMYYSPTYGGKSIQVLNTLKESLYSFVVHANSRNYSYSPNDLLLMIMAVIECFEIIVEMKRAYGIMRKWSAVDEYTPRILLEALGFDYDDLRANYGTMAQDINLIIADMRNLWIPNTFPLLDRTIWLAENVFIDAESPKAQMYCFVRNMHMTYDQKLTSSGGVLIDYNYRRVASYTNDDGGTWGSTSSQSATLPAMKWSKWINAATCMINRMVRMQDRGMICGDIKKAYGESGIFVMPYMEDSFEVTPVYDSEALMSIHNASITPISIGGLGQADAAALVPMYLNNKFTTTYSAGDVYPLGYMTAVYAGNSVAADRTRQLMMVHPRTPILNTDLNDNPSPIEVFKYTRFTLAYDGTRTSIRMGSVSNPRTDDAAYSEPTYNTEMIFPYSTGSEVINSIVIFTKANYDYAQGDGNVYSLKTVLRNNVLIYQNKLDTSYSTAIPAGSGVTIFNTYVDQFEILRAVAAFDWAPILYYYIAPSYDTTQSSIGTSTINYKPVFDYNNYTLAKADDLRNLNRIALFSLYDVPVM